MVRTFLDAGVLIAGARSIGPDQERALRVLGDPNRLFLTSPFVRLEVVPKTVFHRRQLETVFYERYFEVAVWYRDLEKIEAVAQREAANSGLGAMDALHIAAAYLLDADEFVTTEKPGRAIHRSSVVDIVSLFEANR
jgi:predicted nucleic acid-binding protein